MFETRLRASLAAVLLMGCADDVVVVTDATVDARADAADAARDVPSVDAPQVIRCGPAAVRWPSHEGACAAPADAGPAPTGRCTVTITPAGTLRANQTDDGAVVLINGRRIQRAADRVALPGYPMSMLRIPGTSFVVVSDGGYGDEVLRVIDTSGATLAVPSGGEVRFVADGSAREPALFYGLAYHAPTRTVYASGGGANRIYAYTLSERGALTADPGRTIDLGITEGSTTGIDPMTGRLLSAFPAGIALSDDGTELYAALQRGNAVGVFSTVTRAMLRVIPLTVAGNTTPLPYVVARRPMDPRHLYVSLWGASQVAEIDLMTASVSQTFRVGKNPSEMLFSNDGARLYVAAADEDAISEIDLSMPMAPVRQRYLGGSMSAPRGISPTALAWGPMGRMYVIEADENAVEVVDGSTFARVGRIATESQPTDVDVADDGRVYVLTGRGVGMGPNLTPETQDNTRSVVGSIARYDVSAPGALTDGDMRVTHNNGVMRAFNDVTCPDGAGYDFPVPRVGTGRPSDIIHHVILVIRENKTYDALLGDYAGSNGETADGDPNLTLLPRERMPTVFPNLRALVQRFASLDNYYIGAELSNQGHSWTATGRNTDFVERTWMMHDGRSTRGGLPLTGVTTVGLPAEGDIFTAMRNANVSARNWGELVGTATGSQRAGALYPGLVFDNNVLDIDKARAFTDRVIGANTYGRNDGLDCDLPGFTYILLPNDHTQGGSAGARTPVSHFEDNDEATGFLIDAVSHSRFWRDTVIIVIEDDPAQGGDHVDNHRTIALLASPWTRRGHTSHVHYDESSIHHTIELILGVPPHNALVAASAPMYDAFTGTPDFTPYDYLPRRECESRNPATGRWAEASAGMDFSVPDHAPGLDRLVWQMLHDGHEPPWQAVPEEDDDDDD